MLTYTKLWLLLDERGMKKTDLKEVISSATLAKLGKNEPISSTVIEKICTFLNCQPGDIMENITKEDVAKAGQVINEKISEVLAVLSATTGMSREEMINTMMQDLPDFMERLKSGTDDIVGVEDFLKKNE